MSESDRGTLRSANKIILLLFACLLGVATAYLASENVVSPVESVTTGSDADGTPIFTHREAIERAKAGFPADHEYNDGVARLVTRSSLANDWFRYADDDPAAEKWMPDAPLWVVGFRSPKLTLGDTLLLQGFPLTEDPEPVDGIFTIMDAAAGYHVSTGALKDGTRFEYEQLALLTDEPQSIEQATAMPTPTPPVAR